MARTAKPKLAGRPISCLVCNQCLNWIKGEGGAEVGHTEFDKITEDLFFAPCTQNKRPTLTITINFNNFYPTPSGAL